MHFININLPDQPPKVLNVAHISSIEQWIMDGAVKGSIIRMATVAAKDDLQAPVKHVTGMMIGQIFGKLQAAGAMLIP